MSERTSGPASAANPGLEESERAFASALAQAVVRRIQVPQVTSAAGQVGNVSIGAIRLENTAVDHVDITNVDTVFSTGHIALSDARAIVEIRLSVRWWYDFWFASDSGTVSLGSFDFPFDLGDVDIPNLTNIALNVPSAELSDVIAAVHPIENLNLGGASFADLQAANTVLPSAGFGLSGLSLGDVRLRDVDVPAAHSGAIRVGSFTPNAPLIFPSLRVDGLELPAATAPTLRSEGLIHVPQATASQRVVPFSLGVIGFDFRMQPVMDLFIEELVIENLSAQATIGRIDVRDVSVSVTLDDLALDDVTLNRIRVDQVTV
ncbi:MAG: hypothetical protein ACFB3T_12940 [Geminicoccaceae bacterium]